MENFELASGSFFCGKMDFYSGSVPRNRIPFRLGMSSKEGNPISINPDSQFASDIPQEGRGYAPESAPSNPVCVVSQSSGSSGEEVNQYALDYITRVVDQGRDQALDITGKNSLIRPLSENPTRLPALPAKSSGPGTSFFSSKARDLLDSDSDVLSLGECIRVPETSHPFTDVPENPALPTGDSCFTVLHAAQKHSGQLAGLEIGNSEAERSETEDTLEGIGLNSVDPYPHLRRLTGLSRYLLETFFEKNVPVTLSKTTQPWPSARTRFTTYSEWLATKLYMHPLR